MKKQVRPMENPNQINSPNQKTNSREVKRPTDARTYKCQMNELDIDKDNFLQIVQNFLKSLV